MELAPEKSEWFQVLKYYNRHKIPSASAWSAGNLKIHTVFFKKGEYHEKKVF